MGNEYFVIKTFDHEKKREEMYLLKYTGKFLNSSWWIAVQDGQFFNVISFPGFEMIQLPVKHSTTTLQTSDVRPDDYLKLVGHLVYHAGGKTGDIRQIAPVNHKFL